MQVGPGLESQGLGVGIAMSKIGDGSYPRSTPVWMIVDGVPKVPEKRRLRS
jgi:hypothetical protein